jgi:DNA-binding NarL/FixJ family response regulator
MALAAKAEGNAAADDMLREAESLAIRLRKPIDAAECALLRGVAGDDPALPPIDAADLAASARRLVPRRGRESATAIALTAREREVLEHLALHQSNKVIARALGLGGETVKWHVANLLAKLDARDRTHVIERARAMGLLRFRYAGTPLSRVGQPPAADV